MITAIKEVTEHYNQSDLSTKILAALAQAGKDINALTRDDIAPIDEFHIRGRAATREIGKLADFQPGTEILDLGCGIGGAARTLMTEFGCQVTGIDLIKEYILTARILNNRIGLDGEILFEQSNAMHLPFSDNSFDVVFSQHVMMNIADKTRLAEEVRRVLRPGGRFVLDEICAGSVATPHFPLPWAGDSSINYLVEPQTLRQKLEEAGFKTVEWQDVTIPSLRWNQKLVADMKERPADIPFPPGLSLLMGASTTIKMVNMLKSIQEDRLRIIQGILVRTDLLV
jgi:ubiquinone/menaquinone biosynthesis C-methylase UbiE